jgi:hypothetical protein
MELKRYARRIFLPFRQYFAVASKGDSSCATLIVIATLKHRGFVGLLSFGRICLGIVGVHTEIPGHNQGQPWALGYPPARWRLTKKHAPSDAATMVCGK